MTTGGTAKRKCLILAPYITVI